MNMNFDLYASRQRYHTKARQQLRDKAMLTFRKQLFEKLALINTNQFPLISTDIDAQLNDSYLPQSQFNTFLRSKDPLVQSKVYKMIGSKMRQIINTDVLNFEQIKTILLIIKHPLFQAQNITKEIIEKVLQLFYKPKSRSAAQYIVLVEILIESLSLRSDDNPFIALPDHHKRILQTEQAFLHHHQLFYIACLSNRFDIRPEFNLFAEKILKTFQNSTHPQIQWIILQIMEAYLFLSKSFVQYQCVEIMSKIIFFTILSKNTFESEIKLRCLQIMCSCICFDYNVSKCLLQPQLFSKILYMSKTSSPNLMVGAIQSVCSFVIYYDVQQSPLKQYTHEIFRSLSVCLDYSDQNILCFVLKALIKILIFNEDLRQHVDIEKVERLQKHESKEVFRLVELMIDTFYADEFVQQKALN